MNYKMNDIQRRFLDCGLVNILELDSSIKTDIRYATANNFVGKVLYKEYLGVYSVPELANVIVQANQYLKSLNDDYTIVIFDAARPIGVQREMFDLVKGTAQECYIANPYGEFKGGFHNYGMAIDLSICDGNGELVDMGTDFDAFCEEAHVGHERELVCENRITQQAYVNRMLLYHIMGKYGLLPHKYEWWHYQIHQKEEDKSRFKLLDF